MPETHWLVDGMNVIGAIADRWWRDREGAVRRLADRLMQLADEGQPVTLVLDGRPLEDLPEGDHGGVEILYARRGGPDAADDRIIQLIGQRPDAGYLVVTSDRNLQLRARQLGARVSGATTLLRRLES